MSISGALLVMGAAPLPANASCSVHGCLTGTLANVTVDDGSTLNLGTGADLRDSVVSQGFIQLWETAQATGTTVSGNGWLQAQDDARLATTLVQGGTLVVVGSATALNTLVQDGNFEVAQSAAVSNTSLEGGTMWVYGDALAKSTRVENARMTVYENGSAQRTTVNAGGELMVSGAASVADTVINQGGIMSSVAGTSVSSTTVNQGGLMVLGASAAASGTRVNAGGVLRLKGDATLSGSSHLEGQVEFANPAIPGTFHTLDISGPLSGSATFLMNTDLASHRGDLLKVQGAISGTHTLVVADSGNVPSGAQQALRVVDGNGGSGGFQLFGGTVDAGAYRYSLQQQGDDWYLAAPALTGQPEPQAPGLSKGANAAVGSQAATAALLTVQNQSTRQHLADLRSGKDQGGVWTRAYAADQHLDTGTSRAFEQKVNGMEIGADKALPLASGTLYVGALFGQGQGRQDFGERSDGTIDSTTFGGYASYLDRGGLYVGGALKYSRLENDIKVTSNLGERVRAHYRNDAVTAEVQAGKVIDLGQGWFIEPQAGLQVARIGDGHYTASNGLTVRQEALTSVQSRVGGQFGRELQLGSGGRAKPYVKAAWVTEHAGDSDVKVDEARLDSRLPGARAELGGGVMLTTAQQHHLYLEGQYVKGSDIEQPWAVNLGYRYSW